MSTSTSQTVLEVKNVTKSFGTFSAVNDVNLEVRAGEIYGFLGPNGAGKSTTIRLILDILRPSSGNITILGKSSRDATDVHQEIGYLSGEMILETDLTGQQYLDFINSLHGGTHAERISHLATVLDANLSKKIGDYSRGNRQKIG